jgi:hypothetical protein
MLGRRLGEAFPRETVLHSTHLAARALWDHVCESAGTRDVYRVLRVPASLLAVPYASVLGAIDALCARIAKDPSVGRLHVAIAGRGADEILADALAGLSTYHTHPVAERRGDLVIVGDAKLCYYYQNRTAHIVERRHEVRA